FVIPIAGPIEVSLQHNPVFVGIGWPRRLGGRALEHCARQQLCCIPANTLALQAGPGVIWIDAHTQWSLAYGLQAAEASPQFGEAGKIDGAAPAQKYLTRWETTRLSIEADACIRRVRCVTDCFRGQNGETGRRSSARRLGAHRAWV